jgi:hypothetical protein
MEEEGGGKPNPAKDESYEVNYEEDLPLESKTEDLQPQDTMIAEQPALENKPKVRIVLENKTETDKMEDENNKLDAEIEELEKMFKDQI